MELKQGYKRTEIGIIPSGWEVDNLNNITKITRLAGYEYSSLWQETLNGEIIALRGFNIGKNKILERDFVRISNKLSKRLIRSRLFRGDVIYPCVGTIGNAVVIEEDDKYHIQQNIAKITPDSTKINSQFLAYYLMSDFGLNEIKKFNGTSSQPNILVGSLRQYSVILPPIPEQKAIAQVLSDTDQLIQALEQKIAKKRAIKQGAMQKLLTGRRRLKGFTTKGYNNTDIGNIPDDWNLVMVKDLTKFHKQGYYTQESYKPNGRYYLLRGTDMQNPKIDLSTTPKVNSSIADYEAYKVCAGDFLFVRSGAIGRYGIAAKDLPPSIFGSYLINFRFTENVFAKYFGAFYESQIANKQIQSITQGGGNLNINAENIKSLKIPLPSLPEQRAIAQILADMDNEIVQLEEKLNKYKQVKQGLMQNLLTGKIRLL